MEEQIQAILFQTQERNTSNNIVRISNRLDVQQ